MRTLQSLLFMCFALSANATGVCSSAMSLGDVCSQTVIALPTNEDATTYTTSGNVKTSEDREFRFKEVTTTQYGELEIRLGDEANTIDSLVVNGPIDSNDFLTMVKATVFGHLTVINLAGTEIKDNTIPKMRFLYSMSLRQEAQGFILHN